MSRKSKKKIGSGAVAKERLQVVLREDRSQMSAATMAALRTDLVGVIASYATVADENVNFYMVRGDAQTDTKLVMEATVQSKRLFTQEG